MTNPPDPATSCQWAEFRRLMPIVERYAYFDHAAVAPLPSPAAAALAEFAQEACLQGDTAWPHWAEQADELHGLFAQLLGADAAEIAVTHNTTEGITFVAEGLPWQHGDNVVTLADEFPSNQYPWLNLATRGVETRRVPTEMGRVDLDRLASACDARTRIVSISWVSYSSGWRNDLDQVAEMAHRRGALLMIDAIQGLGVTPLDVRRSPIDFLAADGHKWMLGPEGCGVLYIRREHLDRLRPFGVGWNSVRHAHDFGRIELIFRDSAARYEGGSQNMAGSLALRQSLRLLLEHGPEAIFTRIGQVCDEACQRLTAAGAKLRSDRTPEHRSGIVIFDWPGEEPQAARQRCLARGVVLSCRGGGLRISPHAYNDSSDIDRLLAALQNE